MIRVQFPVLLRRPFGGAAGLSDRLPGQGRGDPRPDPSQCPLDSVAVNRLPAEGREGPRGSSLSAVRRDQIGTAVCLRMLLPLIALKRRFSTRLHILLHGPAQLSTALGGPTDPSEPGSFEPPCFRALLLTPPTPLPVRRGLLQLLHAAQARRVAVPFLFLPLS